MKKQKGSVYLCEGGPWAGQSVYLQDEEGRGHPVTTTFTVHRDSVQYTGRYVGTGQSKKVQWQPASVAGRGV